MIPDLLTKLSTEELALLSEEQKHARHMHLKAQIKQFKEQQASKLDWFLGVI
jgi:hypothetical protein